MPDVIIIGGGPAGATAAIYIARAGFSVALVFKDYGALEKAERVENFYGFSKISGKTLVEKGLRQARAAGAKTIRGEVVSVKKTDNGEIKVEIANPAKNLTARAVLVATGATRATPKIDGIADFEGGGVSYCAICDGFFFKGKDVAVLGSDAYSLHEVEDLRGVAASVTVLTNGKAPTVPYPDDVKIRTEKIKKIIGSEPENTFKIAGLSNSSKKILSGVEFESGEALAVAGLFIAEGTAGATALARKAGITLAENAGLREIDRKDGVGYFPKRSNIATDADMRTNIDGIWAAGDCTDGLQQIVKAANDGALAAQSIIKFLRG